MELGYESVWQWNPLPLAGRSGYSFSFSMPWDFFPSEILFGGKPRSFVVVCCCWHGRVTASFAHDRTFHVSGVRRLRLVADRSGWMNPSSRQGVVGVGDSYVCSTFVGTVRASVFGCQISFVLSKGISCVSLPIVSPEAFPIQIGRRMDLSRLLLLAHRCRA